MKRYTVGKMAKVMGVSAQTLRHYEELGLVEAQRNEQNQYREYSMRDNKILMQLTLYRSMGFSLKEIRSLFKEYDEIQVQAAFLRRQQEVDQQIDELIALKAELSSYADGIHKAVSQTGTCQLHETDRSFYAVLKTGSGLGIEGEDVESLIHFQKKAPHIRQGFKISLDHILDNKQPFDFQYGVILNREWAEKHCTQAEIQSYHVTLKGPLVSMILCTSKFNANSFTPMLDFAEKHGYQPAGDLYGTALYMAYAHEDLDYFEFLMPLTEQHR